MIKTLLNLALFVLVAHALFRFVPPYWNHTQFESTLKERMLTWGASSEEDVRQRTLELAHDHRVAIGLEHISARRGADSLSVEVSYSRPIELLPGWKYDWAFTTDVDAQLFNSGLLGR